MGKRNFKLRKPMKRLIIFAALGIMLTACTTTKIVTVPEVHEVHHHHTDSIHQIDSVIREHQTTIMQLDSAAMAAYGIQLKAAERAWLVKTQQLERAIQNLSRLRSDTVILRDSVPVPVPVVKEVERHLTKIEKSLMGVGLFALMALVVFIGWKIKMFLP
jgi:hypothetical protein